MMYLAAAMCLWWLKTWKIGQIEKSQGRDFTNSGEDPESRVSPASSFIKRLFLVKRV